MLSTIAVPMPTRGSVGQAPLVLGVGLQRALSGLGLEGLVAGGAVQEELGQARRKVGEAIEDLGKRLKE